MRYDSDMAKSTGMLFEVKCPCCGASLQIDSELQIVLNHGEPEKKPLIEDLHSAVQQLKGEADRRAEAFEKSFALHRSSEQVRAKKFDELLKQAKEDPSDAPPPRPFDLD
jgi:5'-deoxynucleotidase YfbR-like HD superfamily hydrolase